jgi:hypothetical protein
MPNNITLDTALPIVVGFGAFLVAKSYDKYNRWRAQIATQASQQRFDKAFASIPKDQMWRLFIDLDRQEGGPLCFDEREPGYKAGMERGFLRLRDILGKPFDAKELCHIHDLCIDGIFRKGFYPGAQYGFNTLSTAPAALPYLTSPEAIQQAFDKGLYSGFPDHMPDHKKFLAHYDDRYMRSSSYRETPEEMEARVNGLIDKYYKSIAAAKTNEEKLTTIAELCTSLEIYHPFSDGNQRTIAFILLPKLLIENGFSPAVLERPFLFDGMFTTEQVVDQIKQGIDRFLKCGISTSFTV